MSDLKYVALLSLLIIDLGSIDVKQMEESTKLFLYNEYQINGTEIQNLKPVAVKINPERPIKIICHGLASNSSVYWYDHMIQAYLNLRYNVISVDWNEQANNGYINAINAIDDIGELIANCIANIHFEYHFSMDDIHIIGHSIGAHIAGFFGKHMYNITTKKIGRITGLDPAGPLFDIAMPKLQLSKSDAKFVDVIHTNGGFFGISTRTGHADFYPDGGMIQNSCILKLGCSHKIAPIYFVESITSKRFVAEKCWNYILYFLGFCKDKVPAIMGEHCHLTVSGNFYLSTNSAAPYGRG